MNAEEYQEVTRACTRLPTTADDRKTIINYTNDYTVSPYSLLSIACKYNNLFMLDALVGKGRITFDLVLDEACYMGKVKTITYAISKGAKDYNRALYAAYRGGRLYVMKYLLTNAVSRKLISRHTLQDIILHAYKNNRIDSSILLLEQGVKFANYYDSDIPSYPKDKEYILSMLDKGLNVKYLPKDTSLSKKGKKILMESMDKHKQYVKLILSGKGIVSDVINIINSYSNEIYEISIFSECVIC